MDGQEIHVCVDRQLPAELLSYAMQLAVAENPLNAASARIRSLRPGVMPDIPKQFLAALTGKLWEPGRTLLVGFLDGEEDLRVRVPPFAHVWSEHANIVFEFTDRSDAEIRISFAHMGAWSYLGTDALAVPRNQPTMNFGWLRANTPDDEFSRVATHEFGHALGLIHEHQNPAADIPWDRDAVYNYFQGPPNFWSRQQVDDNLFARYAEQITQFSAFDPASIMMYPISNEFTIGDFEVGWNNYLSDMDKQYVQTIYPSSQREQASLVLDAPPIRAEIRVLGEVDQYQCNIPESGRYAIQTSSDADLVLTLYGPNDATRFIDEHDNIGTPTSARLIQELAPGLYTVYVRHACTKHTGTYHIGIYSE